MKLLLWFVTDILSHTSWVPSKKNHCGGLRTIAIGSYIWMLSHHWVALLRIKLCVLVEVGVALLEEVWHWGWWALRCQEPKHGQLVLSLLAACRSGDLDVELSATSPAPCLPAIIEVENSWGNSPRNRKKYLRIISKQGLVSRTYEDSLLQLNNEMIDNPNRHLFKEKIYKGLELVRQLRG